jgi:hypothetical protein
MSSNQPRTPPQSGDQPKQAPLPEPEPEQKKHTSTPYKASRNGSVPFRSINKKETVDSVRTDIKHEIRRGFMGPRPVEDVLSQFPPVASKPAFLSTMADALKDFSTELESTMSEDLVSYVPSTFEALLK